MDATPEGYHASALDPADAEPFHRLRISRAAALADLAAEYTFFTHALLLRLPGWAADPVAAAAARLPDRRAVVALDLPYPVFQGVGPPGGWNNRLMLCRTPAWPALLREVGAASLIDRAGGRFHRVLAQTIPVPDVLALARMAVAPARIPTVPVLVFGIDGDRNRVGLAPPPADEAGLFRPVVLPPEAATVRLARAFLDGADKPFRALL